MACRARPVGLIAILCLSLAPTRDAAARKFQMSATWVYRTGEVSSPTGVMRAAFLPLQFATAIMDSMGPSTFVHASMGNLTEAFGFPHGPIVGGGGVSATGSAPATLRIPPHRFVADLMTVVPLPGISLVQIATSQGIDAP